MDGKNWRVWDLRLAFGLAVVVFGFLLFMRNIDSELGYQLWSWWPVIMIILGLGMLLQPAQSRQLLPGSILLIVGALILLSNLGLIRLRFRDVWPIILILLGLGIVGRSLRAGRTALGSDYLDISMILGGGEFNFNSRSFKGGKVTAIMGGGSINLREAEMAQDEAVIDILSIMGGVELIVPTSWNVIIHGTPILGGMENKTSRPGQSADKLQEGATRRLIVKGITIMGGLEVKN